MTTWSRSVLLLVVSMVSMWCRHVFPLVDDAVDGVDGVDAVSGWIRASVGG
jgi:hypothetical protein